MRIWQWLFILLFGVSLLTGCQKEETISVEKVSYPDREALRMLGALVQYKDHLWVLKLQGPADEVEQQRKTFDGFVASLSFDDKKEPPLSWKAPPGWKEEAGAGLRFASFRIPAQPREMELTVTMLPREGGSLLQNVNRWRKQLSLPPLDSADLPGATRRTEIGGQEGHLVDIAGLGVHSVSKPKAPGALPAGHPPFAAARPSARPGPEMPFSYAAPESWEKDARPAGLSRASFTVRAGDKKASVTLTPLGGGAGGWAQNIERWRGQVKLPKLPADELAKQVADLDVAGVTAKYVDVNNPDAGVPDNRILGVILPLPDSTWFFKMTGPSDLVGRHKTEFESLVKSIKLGAKE